MGEAANLRTKRDELALGGNSAAWSRHSRFDTLPCSIEKGMLPVAHAGAGSESAVTAQVKPPAKDGRDTAAAHPDACHVPSPSAAAVTEGPALLPAPVKRSGLGGAAEPVPDLPGKPEQRAEPGVAEQHVAPAETGTNGSDAAHEELLLAAQPEGSNSNKSVLSSGVPGLKRAQEFMQPMPAGGGVKARLAQLSANDKHAKSPSLLRPGSCACSYGHRGASNAT